MNTKICFIYFKYNILIHFIKKYLIFIILSLLFSCKTCDCPAYSYNIKVIPIVFYNTTSSAVIYIG